MQLIKLLSLSVALISYTFGACCSEPRIKKKDLPPIPSSGDFSDVEPHPYPETQPPFAPRNRSPSPSPSPSITPKELQ